MNNGVWVLRRIRRRKQPRPGNGVHAGAEEKHCRGQMLRGVNFPVDAKNLLCRRDPQIVDTCPRKCAKPARFRAAEPAVSSMLRVPPCRFRHRSGRQRATAFTVGVRIVWTSGFPSKTGANRSSTTTATCRSGRLRLQQFQSRRRQDTVAERTQPYYSDPRFGARDAQAHFPCRHSGYSSIFASSISITGISSLIG